jgi:hypothetical protein
MPFPILPSNSATGYFLNKSLRFRKSASAYLNRTPASSSSLTTWTWSGWVKRGALSNGGNQQLFGILGGGGSQQHLVLWDGGDQLDFYQYNGGYVGRLYTTQVFRDPSAWYHFVFVWDTTNATAGDRIRMYVNGSRVTAFASTTTVSQNTNGYINSSSYLHSIGQAGTTGNQFFDGYMAEVNFIDGQALTPSSFGETSTTTGVWIPKKYGGTYGTNGFYLPFTNTTSTSTLGNDFSGNSNTWTVNGISLTAGTTYDSMTDVPTLTSATTANYAVMNPLSQSSYITLSGGNLNTAGNTTTDTGVAGSTFGLITGKWYVEYTVNSTNSNRPGIGIIANPTGSFRNGDLDFSNAGSFEYYPNGALDVAGSRLGTFSSFTTNDIIGIAIDCDNGAAYVSKNNTWQNSGVPTSGASKTGAVVTWTPTSTYTQFVAVAQYNTSSTSTNFGQRAFSYTPPTNFNSINTFNLPTPTIGATASTTANEYFDATTYTGTGSSLSITNSGAMQPDLVWIKIRNQSFDHTLVDAVRGTSKDLESNTTGSEQTRSTVTAFNSNGFTVGTDSQVNSNGNTFVAWQWRASNATAVTNTSGTITSTVSANTTAGFSIVTYTGNSTNPSTVGHGLGVAPQFIIIKSRSNAYNWVVGSKAIDGFSSGKQLYLNSNSAVAGGENFFSNTQPTSTVFTVKDNFEVNFSGYTYVAYCFAQVAGYSAFGSYTGNGSSDGPFTYLGFRPKYVLIKRTDSAGGWMISDTSRYPYNVVNGALEAQSSSAEFNNDSFYQYDIVSNGIKIRGTSSAINSSGGTYIYACFAENPFKYTNAR